MGPSDTHIYRSRVRLWTEGLGEGRRRGNCGAGRVGNDLTD